MTRRLYRCYGCGYLHFITFSCYRRLSVLGTAARRDLFLSILEQVRRRYRFVVVGYVVMPEHVHLLLSEPERDTPSTVMQVVKQRFARRVLREQRRKLRLGQGRLWTEDPGEEHVWQRRFYDFPVWTENKRVEKLRYMHRNPVKRGPEQWPWSSFRHYAYNEPGPVVVNEPQKSELRVRKVS